MTRRGDIVSATVIVDGVPFRWWVMDGPEQRLTVAHPTCGARTVLLKRSPQLQAREIGAAMLERLSTCLH
jgi:hypothetical protein